MRMLFTILMILFTVSTVEAYTKQIIFDTFKDKESADAAFEKLKNDKVYKQLMIIAKENDFSVHVIDDNMLVAEPIKNQFIEEAILHLMKPTFAQESVVDIANTSAKSIETQKEMKDEVSDNKMTTESEYPRKIILGTFTEQNGANQLLEEFKKDEAYEKLDALAKESGFVVHSRTLGAYNILIAEPIKNKSVYVKVMELIKPKFADAYSLSDPCSSDAAMEDENSAVTENRVPEPQKVTEAKEVVQKAESAKAAAPKETMNEAVKVASPQEMTENVVVDEQNISAAPTEPVIEDENVDANITAPVVEDTKYNLKALETKVVAPEALSSDSTKEEFSFFDSILKFFGFSSEPAMEAEDAVETAQDKETKAIEQNVIVVKAEEIKANAIGATPQPAEEESSYLSYLWLLLLGIIFAVGMYLFRKFKGVYDTY